MGGEGSEIKGREVGEGCGRKVKERFGLLDCAVFYVPTIHQHSIGYTGDGFYRSKDPTNSIKVLKENLQKKITQRTKKTQNTHA